MVVVVVAEKAEVRERESACVHMQERGSSTAP